MKSIPSPTQPKNGYFYTIGLLALGMAVTRFHHEGTAIALPDASLAAFFLAGAFLGGYRGFFVLLAIAFSIDLLAISALGVSDYCFSPAYSFLVPTYAAMWYAGGKSRSAQRLSLQSHVLAYAIAVAVSTSLAFLISNGSFYWFSGKVAEVGIFNYFLELAKGYPAYLGATAFYVLLGISLEALLRSLVAQRAGQADSL